MKQHITVDQLNELSENEKERYEKWYRETYAPFADDNIWVEETNEGVKEYSLPPMSIGQMIEFLEEHDSFYSLHAPQIGELNKGDLDKKYDEEYWESIETVNPYHWQLHMNMVGFYDDFSLVSILWEAVKEVLK